MILLFIPGFLALAAGMDRHRGWLLTTTTSARMRWCLRMTGWLMLGMGTAGCIVTHGWAMGLVRAVAVATPAAVLVLLGATYLRVRRGAPGPGRTS